jgi:protein-tyrosine phosphatase
MNPVTGNRNSCRSALLVLALSFPVTSFAGGPELPPSAPALNISAIRIDNFGRVSPTYFRGAQPEGGDYSALAKLGVKTVINLTSFDAQPTEQRETERAGMRYIQFPMTTSVPPTAEQLSAFLGVVNDPASQPVYVHCVGGKHRTGVMTAAYRMTNEGWTPQRAFQEMKQYKFGADFLHPEFKAFVYAFKALTAGPQSVSLPAPAAISPVSAQESDAAIR